MTAVVNVEPPLSVSLVPQTLRHELDFLRTVSESTHLADPDVISNAVRRYERFWLPLAAESGLMSLCPPDDVHWVWHCHMLSPYHYEHDCLRLVGKVVDHSVRPTTQLAELRRTTTDVWKNKYNNEPFDVANIKPPAERHERLSSYDLIAAVQRQSKFCYNVSLPHYRDERFLQKAVARYRNFISLKLRHRDAILVPSYDIDLAWHTHQLHPLLYKRDTVEFLGRMFNHDDSLDDRSLGSQQQQAYTRTRQLWMETYGEHFALTGAMYRGVQPHGRLTDITQLRPAHDKKVVLRLVNGSFDPCTMPEHVEQLWGPVPLQTLPEGTDNICLAASHKFVSAAGFRYLQHIVLYHILHFVFLVYALVGLFVFLQSDSLGFNLPRRLWIILSI